MSYYTKSDTKIDFICRGAIANVMVLSYEGKYHEVFSGESINSTFYHTI